MKGTIDNHHSAVERAVHPALAPLLVPTREAARICGIGQSTWFRLIAGGKIGPVPLKLGGRVLWRMEDLTRWTAAGCPDRDAWLAMEEARRRA
ncbi:MAG: helix-turn-helix domain-containing protein [Planctomycetes bacterium]|nr:helix-turn-helix domain-containing protein [Planctomycetota bacterium]